jgi:hypothetical protein
MALLIVGLILLLVAAGAAWFARHSRGVARLARATETSTCGDLVSLASGVREEVGGAGFEQRCEVVGVAVAEGAGTTAPESGTAAVWHRTQLTHRYWEMERQEIDGETSYRRVERTETISDLTSEAPFLVDDDSGRVLVAPEGADVDHPEKVVDRFEREQDRGGRVLDSVLSAVLRSGEGTGTIGFRTEEWVIRPGARLYVHGEVSDSTGVLRFRKPSEGRYVVSTRSEEELVAEDERHALWAAIGGAVAAVAGVALIAAGVASLLS